MGVSVPFASTWRTPASPISGRPSSAARARRASRPGSPCPGSGTAPSGASRRREPGVVRGAKPRFSTARTRACGKSRSTSSCVSSGEPLSTTTRSSVEPLRALEHARQAARQPARLVVRDDDDGEVVHGRTVASARGRDSGGISTSARRRRRAALERGPAARLLRGVSSFELRQSAKVHGDDVARARSSAARPGGCSSESRPLRLHLGSGGHPLEGWVNVDVVGMGPDLHWDLTRRLPFPDGSAQAVFLEHVCEHFPLAAVLDAARREPPPARAGRDRPRRRARLRPLPRELRRRPRVHRARAARPADAAARGRGGRARARPPLGLGRGDARARARRGRVRGRAGAARGATPISTRRPTARGARASRSTPRAAGPRGLRRASRGRTRCPLACGRTATPGRAARGCGRRRAPAANGTVASAHVSRSGEVGTRLALVAELVHQRPGDGLHDPDLLPATAAAASGRPARSRRPAPVVA